MELVTRQTVIENYLHYDSRKKNLPLPENLTEWDWSDPNELDIQLIKHGYKSGILAGYLYWKPVELGRSELSQCAIYAGIFPPTLPRVLEQLIGCPAFESWKPDRDVEWFIPLEQGQAYPRDWPLILRPAVKSEHPATLYLEDGSGRGLCFFRKLVRSNDNSRKAFGYLGVTPDPKSTFMQQRFPSLL